MTEITRRGFIAAGGTFAAAWITADAANLLDAGAHAAKTVRETRETAPRLQFLTAAQAADIDAAASQIIPTDDTPGAHEAGVVYFIDRSLATWAADQRPVFAAGIEELHARAATTGATQAGAPRRNGAPRAALFAALTQQQRHDVIASLEKDRHPFFSAVRAATIVGMLANPEYGGNVNKTGWKLIGFDDRFSWGPPFGWYDAHA